MIKIYYYESWLHLNKVYQNVHIIFELNNNVNQRSLAEGKSKIGCLLNPVICLENPLSSLKQSQEIVFRALYK